MNGANHRMGGVSTYPFPIMGGAWDEHGNPATHIRDRFTQDEVRSLVQLAWWDWPIEVITENIRAIAAGPMRILEEIAQTLPR